LKQLGYVVGVVQVGIAVRCKMNIRGGGELLLEPVFACGECEFPSFRFMMYSAGDPALKAKTATSRPSDLFQEEKKVRSRRRTHVRKG
jgi:hypothetical protein